MGEIVNLRRVRKAKAKAQDETRAAANRIAFGQKKELRELNEAQRTLDERRIDGHKLTDASDKTDA